MNKIIGNKWQRDFLNEAWLQGRLAHAYLLLGPHGIGKKSIAQELASLILCLRPDKEKLQACHQCESCRFELTRHPDYFLFGSDNQEIKVGSIKELRKLLQLKPFVAQARVVIIDNAHLLNEEASNALLKILEEPKGYTYFFLISHNAQKLLPTIISRTQLLHFELLSSDDMEAFVRSQRFSAPTKALVWLAQGSPALVSAWDELLGNIKNQRRLRELSQIISEGELFQWSSWQAIVENEASPIGLELVSQLMMHAVVLANYNLLTESIEKLLALHHKPLLEGCLAAYFNILDISHLLKVTNVNPRLAWENTFWKL